MGAQIFSGAAGMAAPKNRAPVWSLGTEGVVPPSPPGARLLYAAMNCSLPSTASKRRDRVASVLLWRRVAIPRPVGHQPASLLEKVATAIRCLDLVADRMQTRAISTTSESRRAQPLNLGTSSGSQALRLRWHFSGEAAISVASTIVPPRSNAPRASR